MEEKFEPKIAAFVCNWCTYTGADLAGTSRLKYPTNIKMIISNSRTAQSIGIQNSSLHNRLPVGLCASSISEFEKYL